MADALEHLAQERRHRRDGQPLGRGRDARRVEIDGAVLHLPPDQHAMPGSPANPRHPNRGQHRHHPGQRDANGAGMGEEELPASMAVQARVMAQPRAIPLTGSACWSGSNGSLGTSQALSDFRWKLSFRL